MPSPVIYYTAIAATAGGLSTPMKIGPKPVIPIPPDEIFTASGYRKLNGRWGVELHWEITNNADIYEIFAACTTGKGCLRCKDVVPRDGTYETYSDWDVYLDYPIKGEWVHGGVRSNLLVRARRMTLIQNLPTTA